VHFQALKVERADEFSAAFGQARTNRADALIVSSSAFFYQNRTLLVELATKQRLPTIYHHKDFVVGSGGLMSYGPNLQDMFRHAAIYVDKILKGANPADLPIEQPTKFELVINLKTAKALGLTIPPAVLARADEIIQ
jgi:putative tryptophan/tyrosine transport system substrate-binding protein